MSSYIFECLFPGVHHQLSEPIVSFDSYRCDLVVGESLVDHTKPPRFDFAFEVRFPLYYSLASEDPDEVCRFGQEYLEEAGWALVRYPPLLLRIMY